MHWLKSFGLFLRGIFLHVRRTVTSWSPAKKIIVAVVLVGCVAATFLIDVPAPSHLRAMAGPYTLPIFWAIYVIATQFPIPRTLFTLTAGILFGPIHGIVVALTATTVSAVMSLGIVRHFVGDWMAPHLHHPAVARINARLEERGWVAITSLRMIAAIPFSILNYVAAMSPVKMRQFAVATLVGSAPGTIATVLFGETLTGDLNPWMLASTVALACVGIVGLAVDNRTPVKAES